MMSVDRYTFYQAIRTLIVGLFAMVIFGVIFSAQSYWIILSAVLLVQVRVGYLIQQHLVSQLIAGLFTALLVLIASNLGHSTLLLAMFLSLTTGVSVYLGFRYRNLFLAAYLVNLLTLIAGGLSVGMNDAIERSEWILVGCCISLIVTFVVGPSFLRFKIKTVTNDCLKISEQLFKTIFDVYLKKDYGVKHFHYEKNIYYLSRLFSERMKELRYLNCYLEGVISEKILKIDRVFEIVTGLGALRYCVKDHTTFGMMQIELEKILFAFKNKFKAAINEKNLFLDNQADENIDRLDEVYQGALQVASQEPVVYLFFIQGLRALNEQLSQ